MTGRLKNTNLDKEILREGLIQRENFTKIRNSFT